MQIVASLFISLALGAVMVAPAPANAQQFQTLYSFTGSPDGRYSHGIVFDKAGNLYGETTFNGDSIACGEEGCGALFKLVPPANGQTTWTESLYSFNGSDGAHPSEVSLVSMNGALYGTTAFGGYANKTTCQGGCGVVFKLKPPVNGQTTWTETVLHTFTGGADGGGPFTGLVFDTSGALYGAIEGGDNATPEESSLFKLTPPATPKTPWPFTILYMFTGGTDGEIASTLVVDRMGNLYGTTKRGGISFPCCGTVFEFNPATQTLDTLYTFTGGSDGGFPVEDGLTIHYLANGTFVLYGTTTRGGDPTCSCGTVFTFNPATRTLHTLHAFTGGADGGSLIGPGNHINWMNPVVFNGGALYGMTPVGGNTSDCSSIGGCGVVFKLKPPANGQTTWTETVLHTFTGGADGAGPYGRLAFDTEGALYGTTAVGGDDNACPDNSGLLDAPPNLPPGCGVVFKLTP